MDLSSEMIEVQDFQPDADFLPDVLDGLQREPKSLPSKYFYDAAGCRLFDKICELDEYYLTRTEQQIMEDAADEMAGILGSHTMLIEYGSGSSIKTRILLDHLPLPAVYVPVDVAHDHLQATARELARQYPRIEILPVCADFTSQFEIPEPRTSVRRRAGYFPGSTIGNFTPQEATRILRLIAEQCGPGGGLLLGIDLEKESEILQRAYDDPAGVTAEFNLNLLRRINRELEGTFQLDGFHHLAHVNEAGGRVEMHLVSKHPQTATVAGRRFRFDQGETICTEYSHKYRLRDFERMAADAGFRLRQSWTDAGELFAVVMLECV